MSKRTHEPGKLPAVALPKLGDGWHADGGNLYMFVRGNSRSWVFRYTAPDGRRRNMGIGSFPTVGLAAARDMAKDLRAKTKHPFHPVDPIAARKQAKLDARKQDAKRMTFKACAEACIEALRPGWRNEKHAKQWSATLETYAYPVIGSLPVADIDIALVRRVLEPIWNEKAETARRLRARIEAVLEWATPEYRTGENPARWKGNLKGKLAAKSKVSVLHHAALPYVETGDFMQELRQQQGLGPRALEFAILTATRSSEVRNATWDEIDLKAKLWVIPKQRMKAGREHLVPLSDAAVSLLKSLPRLEGTDHVFPNSKGAALSDMALTAVLRRMGKKVTAHGFRSTFRDWAGETTAFPREVIEHALAHQLADKAEAAYQRGTLLEKRRQLMGAWAEYCGTPSAARGEVIPLRRAT